MYQPVQVKKRGSYTANLLGNIQSHLAGLQGYDVMALELIQNADDAKADKIIFNITDDGLEVRNSGEFTYCGDLNATPCGFQSKQGDNYSCDYHRIADVGSGGKLMRHENIGRFGIGFLSTYQVTDHPEIRSAGIKLTLFPESGEWSLESCEEPDGTIFFLPWARDPNTQARVQLGISHIEASHIDQLTNDLRGVLRQSLLFLKHVRSAELRRDGVLLLACDLERDGRSGLIVNFRPGDDIECWHILRTDASEAAEGLREEYPLLKALDRSTQVSVGLRTEPGLLAKGLLYAFLPTEQSSGLPLHINADFFPESDRKAVIFTGHQHQQAWNEMLVRAAAEEVARDPEYLLTMLGHVQLWEILSKAFELISKSSAPQCYKHFWECLKVTASSARIIPTEDGSRRQPGEVFLPRNPLTTKQTNALLEIGGQLASEDLRPFQIAMGQLGAHILTLKHVVNLLESEMNGRSSGATRVDEYRLTNFYRPLWSILDNLLPEPVMPNAGVGKRLKELPIMVTEDLSTVVVIDDSHAAPAGLAARITAQLPGLAIASHHFVKLPKLGRLIQPLNLGTVVSYLRAKLASQPVEEVINIDPMSLSDFYMLLADIDSRSTVDITVYESLQNLSIWRSGRGLVKATKALLPGDFKDPIGQADILDIGVFSEQAREFVSNKLGIETLTIKSYVEIVLPEIVNDTGSLDPEKYERLIKELSNHSSLVDEEKTCELLGSLPLAPTQDGGWSRPTDTYHRSEHLVRILGDTKHLWLDESRLPDQPTVHRFLDNIGIRRSATARHLVERICNISFESLPTGDAKKASGEAFYEICKNYEAWKNNEAFREAIADLRNTDCFPSDDDMEEWHWPDSLYAPFRANAFRSQARILAFRDTQRLNTDLLEDLGVTINPSTDLVIGHLKHCMERGIGPDPLVYQVLNERAKQPDPLIAELKEAQCIYVEDQGKFVRTNRVYWTSQPLGVYAFTVPESMKSFTPLFRSIGVKDAPECSDYVDILLDIVENHFEKSAPVVDSDLAIYNTCLAAVATAYNREECDAVELQRLREAPTILNSEGMTTYPDEILLHDSEWYATFFNGELNRALCKLSADFDPLVMELGVRRLSKSTSVSLEYFGGEEQYETELAEKLADRKDIFARLVHDKSATVSNRFREALSLLKAVSYDVVQIKASVQLTNDAVSSPPRPVQAFYDINEGLLTVCRSSDDRRWPGILNAIFHQLMPEAPGNEISILVLCVGPLMEMTVHDAHCQLTDAGVPPLDISPAISETVVVSPKLGELGTRGEQQIDIVAKEKDGELKSGDLPEDIEESTGYLSRTGKESNAGRKQQYLDSNEKRPKYKEQRDRRLLSYVRRKPEEVSERQGSSEHNLALEVVARKAVCDYEEAQGRVAEQKAQTHPGYDIVSHDPSTGEERVIEVKGVAGEWNQTGVGLSRTQFSNAQDYGVHYWLYVVEFASDPDRLRVHPIRNPAMQITSFMFDGNWRQAAE